MQTPSVAYVKLPLAFKELQRPPSLCLHTHPPEKHSRLALHRETKAQLTGGAGRKQE